MLIDDLDRCLPRHIIDNLEAIKLFLNVPKTAFVIAADSYIVSNAIKSEYREIIDAAHEERPLLGDFLSGMKIVCAAGRKKRILYGI